MTIDIDGALRRVNWQANKRTLMAAHRVHPDQLARAQALHGKGAYEACVRCITSSEHWESDPRAWRLVGLSRLGLRNHAGARQAFERARFLNGLEVAKDEVNIATAHISAHAYEEALEAARRARAIAPFLASAHICILAIYNRTGRHDELVSTIADLLTNNRDILHDPDFLERLANDTDLIGVRETVTRLKEKTP
jgi:tetratricopeptide (TPR) repeat protein